MIGGVEVGCQVFGVPEQPDRHPLFRTVPASPREGVQQLGPGNPEPVQPGQGRPQADPATV